MSTISREEAAALGLKRFFTGIPCPRLHVSERLTSNGGCIACLAISKKKHYLANKERAKDYQIEYRRKNADHLKAQKKKYREENRERLIAKDKAYYQKNKEKSLAYTKAWVAANPERRSIIANRWRKLNPEKVRAYVQNYQAKKLGLGGVLSDGLEERLLLLQKWKCASCKKSLKTSKYHLDHIEPLSRGGRHEDSNMQILCATCNLKKSNKEPHTFMQQMGFLL